MNVSPVRAVVKMSVDGEVITTVNSGVFVRGIFYDAIKEKFDEKTSRLLHDTDTKKPFSLSPLRSPHREYLGDGLMKLGSPVYFIASSVYPEILDAFISYIEEKGELEFPNFTGYVYKIKTESIKNKEVLVTKTPALFRAMNRKHFFELGESEFFNAFDFYLKRVELYGGKIRDYSIYSIRKKMVYYEEKLVPGHTIKFRVDGDSDILIAIGLGSGSTVGFGIL